MAVAQGAPGQDGCHRLAAAFGGPVCRMVAFAH